MNWKFWKKPDKDAELQLYDSFAKPTRILKNGKRVSNLEDAEKVKADFLKLDSAYDGLFEKVFLELTG